MGSRYEQLLCRGEIREVLLQQHQQDQVLLLHAASAAAGAAGAGVPGIILYLVNSLQRAWVRP